MGAVGNRVFGLVAGGYSTQSSTFFSTSYRYVFSTDVFSGGPALGAARDCPAGASSATVGLITGGNNNGTNYSYSDIFTFSSGTISPGTSLGQLTTYAEAFGNASYAVVGMMYLGGNTTYTDKYTYSGNVRVSGTSMTVSRCLGGGVSTVETGIFAAGIDTGGAASSVVEKYTYASSVFVTTTSLTATRVQPGAAGNKSFGVIAGGFGSNTASAIVATTDKYYYANSAVVAGSNLTIARGATTGVSSTPGHY